MLRFRFNANLSFYNFLNNKNKGDILALAMALPGAVSAAAISLNKTTETRRLM